jgi:mRNA-degrading endonuclease RelE of RelBE toxin-antitoxin system
MAEDAPPYRVVLGRNVAEAIRRFRRDRREKTEAFLAEHASVTPTTVITGKLKHLRGQRRNYYQFDIDRSYRLIYRVDEAERTMYVEYAGPHPDWAKSRTGRIRS